MQKAALTFLLVFVVTEARWYLCLVLCPHHDFLEKKRIHTMMKVNTKGLASCDMKFIIT